MALALYLNRAKTGHGCCGAAITQIPCGNDKKGVGIFNLSRSPLYGHYCGTGAAPSDGIREMACNVGPFRGVVLAAALHRPGEVLCGRQRTQNQNGERQSRAGEANAADRDGSCYEATEGITHGRTT